MRVNISDRAKAELLEIMQHYGYTSTAHTLNVIIGSLYESIFIPSLKEGKQVNEQTDPRVAKALIDRYENYVAQEKEIA